MISEKPAISRSCGAPYRRVSASPGHRVAVMTANLLAQSIPRRHRPLRSLQSHPHALRLPGRRTHLLASPRCLLQNVAPLTTPTRSKPPSSSCRRSRRQPGHLPRPGRTLLRSPQRTRRHRPPRLAPLRRPRPRSQRIPRTNALRTVPLARTSNSKTPPATTQTDAQVARRVRETNQGSLQKPKQEPRHRIT